MELDDKSNELEGVGFQSVVCSLLTQGTLPPSGARACSEQFIKSWPVRKENSNSLWYSSFYWSFLGGISHFISQYLNIGCIHFDVSWCCMDVSNHTEIGFSPARWGLAAKWGLWLKGMGTVLQLVSATLKPQYCLNEEANAKFWSPLDENQTSHYHVVTGNSVSLVTKVKTRLVPTTASSKRTSITSSVLFKHDLFNSVTMTAGKQRQCNSWHCGPSAQQLQHSALDSCFFPPTPVSCKTNYFIIVILIIITFLIMYV